MTPFEPAKGENDLKWVKIKEVFSIFDTADKENMLLTDKRLKLTLKRIEAMHALGLTDTESLLSYYPVRYDSLHAVPFSSWQPGMRVTVSGTLCGTIRVVRFGRNKSVARFLLQTDEGNTVNVSIFNRPWLASTSEGTALTVTGVYKGVDRIVAIQCTARPLKEMEAVTPVYSAKADVAQRTIRACIQRALDVEYASLVDDMPLVFKRRYRLLDKRDALRMVHMPKSMEEVGLALRTLKYAEFLRFFCAVSLRQNEDGASAYKPPRFVDRTAVNRLLADLAYPLTEDQKKCLDEILADMEASHVMHRLLQGDVGCGKTVVAGVALYGCVTAGMQGVLLAPTELLVRQHLQSLQNLLRHTDTRITALYSDLPAVEQTEILKQVQNGQIDILIGTHSLLAERVQLARPGLIVVDEQQRFGVEQRRRLWRKGAQTDFLMMSATPIPRTLASALFGDMEVSTIVTMPPGRKPVKTYVLYENSFRSVRQEVEQILASGHQLYVICAAIERNAQFKVRSVQDITRNLQTLFQNRYVVSALHGALSGREKESIMQDFAQGKVHVLVSTTVVEVGVNVPNATGMIVYDADRFGLSQLHQLRGRIQRGREQGVCWLLTGSKDEQVHQRLEVLEKSSDGFEIAWQDLRLRGPGDILGTRQSGLPDFTVGSLAEDTKIMQQARLDAQKMMQDAEDPDYRPFLDHVRTDMERRRGA